MCILALFSRLSVVCLVLSGPKGTSFFSCSRYSRNLARLQTHKHRPGSADIHQRVGTFAQRRSAASPEGRGGGSHQSHVLLLRWKTKREVLQMVTEYLFLCRFGLRHDCVFYHEVQRARWV